MADTLTEFQRNFEKQAKQLEFYFMYVYIFMWYYGSCLILASVGIWNGNWRVKFSKGIVFLRRNRWKGYIYYKIYWGWPERGGVETPIFTMAFSDGVCFVRKWTSFSLLFYLLVSNRIV